MTRSSWMDLGGSVSGLVAFTKGELEGIKPGSIGSWGRRLNFPAGEQKKSPHLRLHQLIPLFLETLVHWTPPGDAK